MDVIANMLTSVWNAQRVGKESVAVPHGRKTLAVLEALKKSGFVADLGVKGRRGRKVIEVSLAYNPNGIPKLRGVRRISRLSRRVYLPYRALRPASGIQLVSTTKGVMSAAEARKAKLGGEILCEVW